MTTRMTDRAITRCPECGSWRWWNRCFTCVPKAAQVHNHEEKAAS